MEEEKNDYELKIFFKDVDLKKTSKSKLLHDYCEWPNFEVMPFKGTDKSLQDHILNSFWYGIMEVKAGVYIPTDRIKKIIVTRFVKLKRKQNK